MSDLKSTSNDDGNCRSCEGDKCVTGPECVTLGRDNVRQEIDSFIARMPGGMNGFLKEWGLAQFAEAILKYERGPFPIYRHVKSGGDYHVLNFCALREHDQERMVVYRSVANGHVWIRPYDEFMDGRFERIES